MSKDRGRDPGTDLYMAAGRAGRRKPWPKNRLRPVLEAVRRCLYPLHPDLPGREEKLARYPAGFELDECAYVPENVAFFLKADLTDVRMAMERLVKEGFLGRPVQVSKEEAVTVGKHQLVWAGRWIRRPEMPWRTLRRRNGRSWSNPPTKAVMEAYDRLLEKSPEVVWSGVEYPILTRGKPYLEYGEKHGLFWKAQDKCRRCGGIVPKGARGRPGKHLRKECDARIAKEVMGA